MKGPARFSGRQKMKLILSPAKAGSTNLLETVPRAALRFTSFRYARPGLNSAAGDAGLLISSPQALLRLAFSLTLIFFSGCAKQPSNQSSPNYGPANEIRSSGDVVKISAPDISIPAGGSGQATVILSISPGYHVNANPATFPYLIATEVTHTTDPDDPFMTGKAAYPPPVKKKFQFADEPLAVYEGAVSVTLPLRLAAAGESYISLTKGAKASLPVNVRIQACDQEQCFPPDTLHTTIAVDVK